MAVRFQENASAGMDSSASSNVPTEEAVFRARIPTVLEMGAARIPDPTFPLPSNAYKYPVAAINLFRTGIYRVETPKGEAVITLGASPFDSADIGHHEMSSGT